MPPHVAYTRHYLGIRRRKGSGRESRCRRVILGNNEAERSADTAAFGLLSKENRPTGARYMWYSRRGGGWIKSLFGLITSRRGAATPISFANRQRRRLINNFDAKCTRTLDDWFLPSRPVCLSTEHASESRWTNFVPLLLSSGSDPMLCPVTEEAKEFKRDSIEGWAERSWKKSRDDRRFSIESTKERLERERERERESHDYSQKHRLFSFLSLLKWIYNFL